jgi:hypothetical protein
VVMQLPIRPGRAGRGLHAGREVRVARALHR